MSFFGGNQGQNTGFGNPGGGSSLFGGSTPGPGTGVGGFQQPQQVGFGGGGQSMGGSQGNNYKIEPNECEV